MAAQGPSSTELRIIGPIDRIDIPGLCEYARELLREGDFNRLVCDVARAPNPDAVMVDALARLQLTARRVGGDMRLAHAPPELLDLLGFMGLSEAIQTGGGSDLEARRQAEHREQRGGVEEERDPTDPAG